LNGKRVFIKGYIRPGSQQENIENFLLVRDNGACCYGNSLPAAWDMIEVKMQDSLKVDYHTGLFKMAGTFRVAEPNAANQLPQVAYSLEADYKR
jgi:hypothetical protein